MFTFLAARTHTFCLLMMLRGQGLFPAPSTCVEDGGSQAFLFLYSLLEMMENMQVSLRTALTEKPLSLASARGLLSVMSDHRALCCTLITPPYMQERGSLFHVSESKSNHIQVVQSWKWSVLRKGKGYSLRTSC